MIKRLEILKKNTGISPYIWALLTILPFYFIFQASETMDKVIGFIATIFFFILYRLAYQSKGWTIYLWPSLLIGISITGIFLYSYVYFAFFLSYFIGNITKQIPFTILYIVHLVLTSIFINMKIILADAVLMQQLPFVLLIWFGVILFPLNIHTRQEKGQLEEQLEDANKRIAELVKLEERQRIARDLHDTLGQKLSLIGLKSDLARKLVYKSPEQAKKELIDIQQTSRTALNEVRKMVSQMRGIKLKDEIHSIRKLLTVASISLTFIQEKPIKISSIVENILCMCLKEGITNIVKHSGASICTVILDQTSSEIKLIIDDNGKKPINSDDLLKGNGLIGMKERLEFINGYMKITFQEGTRLEIIVPSDGKD